MMKKKIQVVKNVKTREELNKFLTPDFEKVLVLNIYDDFWGACEVAEPLIKRFQEDPMNLNRVEWVSVDRSIAGDLIPKGSFGSKPKYFLFVNGELFSTVEGIDYPILLEELKKSFLKLDEVAQN